VIIHNGVTNNYNSQQLPLQTQPSSSHTPFDGPGERALCGPRHDNDHAAMKEISLLPTGDEVLCRDEPYLPVADNMEPSPHFLPKGWPRHLDDHFRLYRQDMLGLFSTNIQAFVDLLDRTEKHSDQDFVDSEKLASLAGGNTSFNVYSNVQFLETSTENYYPGLTKISFDQPLGIQNLDQNGRQEFWEHAQGRLMKGSLVCMARRLKAQASRKHRSHQIVLALVQERDIPGLAESERDASVQVFFTDPAFYSTVFAPEHSSLANRESWFLIDCPGSLFDSYRCVLKALQSKSLPLLPFGKYIAPTDEDAATPPHSSSTTIIDPPLYATSPGSKFDLSVLLEKGVTCDLDVQDALSIEHAKGVLREHSSLDDSQASALVDTLCREFALINGYMLPLFILFFFSLRLLLT
jgi:hypothetical protein